MRFSCVCNHLLKGKFLVIALVRIAADGEKAAIAALIQGGQNPVFALVKRDKTLVAYPLLRVEIQEVEIERERDFPPSLLGPTSIEPFDL